MSKSEKPVALFVYGAFRRDGGGLGKAWFQRLQVMHDAGWEIHVALLSYRRYKKKSLSRVLGGTIPSDVIIHKYWQSPMNPIEVAATFMVDATKYALRRVTGKKRARFTIEPRPNGMVHEWQYDPMGRLIAEVDRDVESNQVKMRIWYDTGGNPILREWFGVDEDDLTKVQRPSDPEPVNMVTARVDWLNSLNLPKGCVVFSDSPYTYPVVATLPDHFGKIFVMHLNHLKRGEGPLGILTPRMRNGLDPYADRPDAVVCATPDQAEDLKIRFGENFPVYPIRPVVKKVETPSDVERDRHKIVAVGRLVDVKRLHHVFEAMPMILEAVPDAHLDIWGSGNDRERLDEVLDQMQLHHAVSFRGYTGTPEMVFRTGGCSVLTSRRESYALAVTESLLQGCPVVSYDVKYGPRTVIQDGINGFIVPDNDIQALAQRVIEILTNPELQDSMGREGLKVAELVDHAHYQKAWETLTLDVRAKALARAASY